MDSLRHSSPVLLARFHKRRDVSDAMAAGGIRRRAKAGFCLARLSGETESSFFIHSLMKRRKKLEGHDMLLESFSNYEWSRN